MSLTLGLDMGTNSIGWALIHPLLNEIIAIGSHIFPEGVNRDNLGREVPKNFQRRTKRQTRRLVFRSKFRKWLLAKALMQSGMFPPTENIPEALQREVLPGTLASFFSINPYECRSRAYHGGRLSLTELGRVFYHFAQRRGYKESLKNDDADMGVLYDGNPKDGKTGINDTRTLIDKYGTLGNALYNIDPNKQRLRNRYTTRRMYTDEFEKIWESQRQYYPAILTDELKQKIGDATEGILFFQRPLKPQSHLVGICTLEQREIIKDGKRLLVGKQRCSDGCIAFELRRTYEFINTIKIDNEFLSQEQRAKLEELFFSKEKFSFADIAAKLKVSPGRFNYEEDRQVVGTKSISALRKVFTPKVWDAMTLPQQEQIFNIKAWAEDKSKTTDYLKNKYALNDKQISQFLKFKPSKGHSNLSYKATINILSFLKKGHPYHEAVWLGGIYNVLGPDRVEKLNPLAQEQMTKDALAIYYDEAVDNMKAIKQWLKDGYGVSEKNLKKLYHHSLDLLKGDGSLDELPAPDSTRNPVVQQALFELRRLVNTIISEYGKPSTIKIELSRELKSSISERDEMRLKQFRNEQENDGIKKILDEYGRDHTVGNIQKLKLYREIEHRAGLVRCPYTGNAIGMHQLWNGEVDVEHIIPYSICLDDSLQNKTLCFANFNRRKGNRMPYSFYNTEIGAEAWEEVKQTALTLLPYKKWLRFIDDKPKVLEEFEQRKLNDNRYISRVAKSYLEKICKHVMVTQGELTATLRHYWGLDGILNPPLSADGLENGGEYYVATDANRNGIVVAKPWQQQSGANKTTEKELAKHGVVLQGIVKDGFFRPYKTRYDHRHHAVDALTVAWTERRYLQSLSTMKGRARSREERDRIDISFPEPWQGYYGQAKKAVERIAVSHKKSKKLVTKVSKLITHKGEKIRVKGFALRGPLHGESIFGKRFDIHGNQAFHIRKHLSQIGKRAQIDKIADPVIKLLVEKAVINTWQETKPELYEQYVQQGLIINDHSGQAIDHSSKIKYDVPEGAFFSVEKDESGKKIIGFSPKVFLPKGDAPNGVPVFKVRLKENSGNAVQLKGNRNQWVEPDNNYSVLVYEKHDGDLEEKIITFWDAVEATKQKTNIVSLPAEGKKIITTMQINDLFLLGIPAGEVNWEDATLCHHLYRVQKLSSCYYVFRKATAATIGFPSEQISIQSFKAWKAASPIKVTVDILGRIKPDRQVNNK